MGIPTESGCDKQYFDKSGICLSAYECAHKGEELKCLLYTKPSAPRKMVVAAPHEETKIGLPPVKPAAKPVREISSLMPKIVLEKPKPTSEDCANGGKNYFKLTSKGGVCIAESCPYRTKFTVEITVRKGGADEKKELPICIAHSIDGCLADGNKSLFHEGANGCIAAGIAECPEQDTESTNSMDDVVVCFCRKYSV
jgi:hypothetical protein